jgi:hypothetical protein
MNVGLILVALALGGGKGPQAVEPVYEFSLKKEGRIDAAREKERTVFLVTSPRGIGQAGIKLKAGSWPEIVTLRFQYVNEEDKGFANLEQIWITTDRIHTEGSLKASGQFAFLFLDGRRQKPVQMPDDRRAAGVLRVRVEQRNGAVEVTLPAHLLTGSTQLDLSWIDAFRR